MKFLLKSSDFDSLLLRSSKKETTRKQTQGNQKGAVGGKEDSPK